MVEIVIFVLSSCLHSFLFAPVEFRLDLQHISPIIVIVHPTSSIGNIYTHYAATMSGKDEVSKGHIPVFLLKTKSIPNDGYQEQFSASKDQGFDPIFVPVLEHKFFEEELAIVKELLQKKLVIRETTSKYGGMIFTSQRAVEAFSRLVCEGKGARNQ